MAYPLIRERELDLDDDRELAELEAYATPYERAEELTFALGYGEKWDRRIRSTLESFLTAFEKIPINAGGSTIPVHPPYYINSTGSENSRRRVERAAQNRRRDAAKIKGLLNGRFEATVGKATMQQIHDIVQGAVNADLVTAADGTTLTSADLRAWLVTYGLGVDCSGFVSQALNLVLKTALGRELAAAEKINTNSLGLNAAISGRTKFDLVANPGQLCPGDTMGYNGHIRIVTQVAQQADGAIEFYTAESSSIGDIGPTANRWRYRTPTTFTGLQRFGGADGASWAPGDVGKRVTFSRYKALAAAVAASPDGPSAQALALLSSGLDLNTADVSEEFVTRAHARAFHGAEEVNQFFQTLGATDFIDWYNKNLAGHGPFAERGKITARNAGGLFTTFWQAPQIRALYDGDTVNLLDFVALTCISINETGGSLKNHTEACGNGRVGVDGVRHRGLAYAFDEIVWPKRGGGTTRKRSYNTLSGNIPAGRLFADPAYVRAHRSLGMGDRLNGADGTDGIDPRWNGTRYPEDRYSVDENLAANGFIMQADFYKFRGRGPIQVTGRGGYRLVLRRLVNNYGGTNAVLTKYKTKWTGVDVNAALTASTNADWDTLYGETEFLALSVRAHSEGVKGYLRMSDNAGQFLQRTSKAHGSVFRMGALIGSTSYATLYRNRVMAMLNLIPITQL